MVGIHPSTQGARAAGRRTHHQRRPPGARRRHRAAFPGGELATLPGPLRAESARDGRRQASRAAERRPPRHLRAAARACAQSWRASHPQVATTLAADLAECLACYAVPVAHRPRIRTTNGLERLTQELKRRTRVVRIFPNRAAVERLVTALAMEQSAEWVSGRRYLNMDPFWEDRRRPVAPAPLADAADGPRIRAWRAFTERLGLDLSNCKRGAFP